MALHNPLPNRHNQYHPLIPTLKSANENPEQINSDHMSQQSTAPVKRRQQVPSLPVKPPRPVKIITWNVYRPGNPYGFASGADNFLSRQSQEELDKKLSKLSEKDKYFYDNERLVTYEVSERREERNVNAIKLFIKMQNPDVIVLQEANDPRSFPLEKMKDKFAPWEVVAGKGQVLMLYNPQKLKMIDLESHPHEESIHHIKKGFCFVDEPHSTDNQPDFIVNNFYISHDDFPQEAENSIKTTLALDTQMHNCTSIIAGDFNNRVVPLDAKEGECIITGACPAYYRAEKGDDKNARDRIQGLDFTDGFIYQQPDEKECHQPQSMDTLDPSTGEIYHKIKLDLANFDERHQKEILRQRHINLRCRIFRPRI
jgi:hypothetical protein